MRKFSDPNGCPSLLSAQRSPRLPRVYAILEGGGVKGSALVGALREVVRNLEVVGIGGTSAGAIVAALFAAGYSADELQEIMLDVNYRRFAKRLLWPRSFGIHSSAALYEWMRGLLAQKYPGQRRPVYFSDLPMPLKVVAADIRNRETVVFDRDRYPRMEVALAVRMSMSIPVFYEMISEGGRQLVDGGIISNFPIWLFDEERLASASGVSVIGLDLIEPVEPSTPIRTVRDYAAGIVETVMAANRQLIDAAQRGRRNANIIAIPTGDTKATDFDIDRERIEWLSEQGAQAAREFFATQSVGSPDRSPPPITTNLAALEAGLKNGNMSASEAITQISRQHLFKGGVALDAGTFERVFMKYYIDLMEAALDPRTLRLLVECAVSLIEGANPGAFNVVAGIKMGNPIFAAALAGRLHKRAVLVKNIFTPRGGYPFDGEVFSNDQAIVIDDVASDGTFLLNAVQSLRAQGVRVVRVLTLIERKEGNVRQLLENDGCGLDSLIAVDDADLERSASPVSATVTS